MGGDLNEVATFVAYGAASGLAYGPATRPAPRVVSQLEHAINVS
jgi:hypothetical protein